MARCLTVVEERIIFRLDSFFSSLRSGGGDNIDNKKILIFIITLYKYYDGSPKAKIDARPYLIIQLLE